MTIETELTFDAATGWEQVPKGYVHRDVSDVAVDAHDNVYLLTRFDARVIVYDRNGRFLRSWGEAEFSSRPHGITVGPDGLIYIVDETDQTIRKYTPEGKLLLVIGVSGVLSDSGYDQTAKSRKQRDASIVRGAGPFNHPTSVAITSSGDLYASDGYGNARIHHFSATGELLHSWGEPGSGPGEFRLPHSISIDGQGRVLVSDRENDRIQLFTADGDFIEEWTDIQRPAATAIDKDGLVFVPELARPRGEWSWRNGIARERAPSRLSILDSRGRVLRRIGLRSGEDPCAPGSFAAPHGVAVDSCGDLYVAEVTYSMFVARGPAIGADYGPYVGEDCHTLQKLTRRGAQATSGVKRFERPSI